MFELCEILGLCILPSKYTFKASLNHTSCEQLQGTILLAANRMENYSSQIDHTRDWDEERCYISDMFPIRKNFPKVSSKAKESKQNQECGTMRLDKNNQLQTVKPTYN